MEVQHQHYSNIKLVDLDKKINEMCALGWKPFGVAQQGINFTVWYKRKLKTYKRKSVIEI